MSHISGTSSNYLNFETALENAGTALGSSLDAFKRTTQTDVDADRADSVGEYGHGKSLQHMTRASLEVMVSMSIFNATNSFASKNASGIESAAGMVGR